MENQENNPKPDNKNIKRGVSAIIYDHQGMFYFLILHRIKEWNGWEFPKGGIEEGETPERAVAREIIEETGHKNAKITFKLGSKREFEKNGTKYVYDIYLAETNMNFPVKIDQSDNEHDTWLWATKEKIMENLTWNEEKESFKEALNVLEDKED